MNGGLPGLAKFVVIFTIKIIWVFLDFQRFLNDTEGANQILQFVSPMCYLSWDLKDIRICTMYDFPQDQGIWQTCWPTQGHIFLGHFEQMFNGFIQIEKFFDILLGYNS